MRSDLERLAADGDHSGRDESYLLRGGRLSEFDEWAADDGGDAGPLHPATSLDLIRRTPHDQTMINMSDFRCHGRYCHRPPMGAGLMLMSRSSYFDTTLRIA
jgi:hypothetical protein